MSQLTIDSVHTKKQVYPVIINFQNGYPTDDFEIDCALVLQGKNSIIRTIATELDELVYAGQEDYEDLGRTYILARDKNTGKVRLIESGSAELKPQNEDNNQMLEIIKLETEEIDKLVPDRLNYINTPEPRECNLEPDMANCLPHEETSFLNTSINNFEQLEIPDSSNSSQFNTDEFEPGRSYSPQKLNNECGEPDLNMLFSIAPEHKEVEPNKYDCAEQDACESELNITNSHKKLEISKIQTQQMKAYFKETIESEAKQLQQVEDILELNKETDLKKSNLSQPLETAELEYDINHSEQLSPGELETGLWIEIELEVLDLNRLPGEAGLAAEADLPGEARLAGDDGLAGEAGLISEASFAGDGGLAREAALIGEAGLIGEASLAGDDGLALEAGLIGEAGLTGDNSVAGEAGLAGDDGLAGDAGLIGEAGLTGDDGLAGDGGLAGEAGLTGDNSVAGEAGLAGDDGLAGDAGLIGEAGLTGDDGLAGDGGLAGEAGLTGDNSVAGEAGLTGDDGLAGDGGLAGEAGLAGDDGLAGEAGLTGDDGLAGDGGLAGEAGLTEQAGLIGEAGLTGDDGLAGDGGLAGEAGLTEQAGRIGEASLARNDGLAGQAGLKLQHEKNKVDPNKAKTLEDQKTSICEQNCTTKTQASDANKIEFDRLPAEKHTIVPERADDRNVEKDDDELNFVDFTTEVRDGKYNHMMNYYHDEIFVPNNSKTNLTNNNKKRKCLKDFSTVKEMVTESLGLKLKVPKKLKTENGICKNHMNKQKDNVSITCGHKAIINKQSNDDNKTQNIFSYKYNKQALESQAYTCDYCKNVFQNKDSLIFHLASHQFTRNTKNVVLKPLVERIVEVANTKSRTCRTEIGNHKRNKKKINGLDGPENRTSTRISNTVVNSKTTEIFQHFYENAQTINNAKNRPKHFTKGSTNGNKTAGNLSICNHCKERFKDEDSLIFHFGTCINSLKTPKNFKARKDNSIKIYDDATTNREAHKAKESAAVNTEQTKHLQKLCNEIKIADNFENCPIHLEKDNSRENNESQIIPERNYICEYCENIFEDKGSLIFHLVAHKINNTMEDIDKDDKCKIKCNRNNTIGEETKCLQSSENKIETLEIRDYESKTICDKDVMINNELRNVKENVLLNIEQRKNLQIKNNFENLNDSKNATENNTYISKLSQEAAGNNFTCNYCEKAFEQNGLLICHIATHQIYNSLEIVNASTRKFDKRCINKKKENETVIKITEENCISTSIDDDIKNHEANKATENILVNPEEHENTEMYTEVEITDNSRKPEVHVSNKNLNIVKTINTCAYDYDSTVNCTQKLTPENFEEKGSHVCQLEAHKVNDTMDVRKLRSSNKYQKHKENVCENNNSKGVCKNDVETHRTIKTKNIDTSNSRINRSHSKDKINNAINARQFRSYNKNQKHKVHDMCVNKNSKSAGKKTVEANIIEKNETISLNSRINRSHSKDKINNAINVRQLRSSNRNQKHKVHNVCVNKNSKSACKKAKIIEKSETISLNSRINSSQLKDKINVRRLRSFNTNHIEQKHKEILLDICGNRPIGISKENIDKKDRTTTLDNIDKTSPNIHINDLQSKKVLRVQHTPLKTLTNNLKGKKVSLKNEPSANNNFICNDCGRVLKSKDTLIAHLENHSGNSKTSSKKNTRKCNTCQSKFATLSELINHEIKVHKTTKAYKSCTLCEYKTLYKSSLADHKRAHLNIKSFKCSYCMKAFGTKPILKRHIRRHTGEKPFKCEICNKAFCVKSDLDLHLFTHAKKAFKCTICRKTFGRATDLKRHMIIHSNKKPFKCATCSSGFNDRSALLGHERKHTGEKPYRYKVLRIGYPHKKGTFQ